MNNLIKPSILITLLITLVSCGGGGGSSPSVTSAPSAPSGLSATANNESQITLSWDQTTGATRYEVYRHTSDDSTAATKINTETVTDTSYINTGLTESTKYYYWIKACNDTGCSNFSTEANATTTPPAPSNLSATVNNANQITLSWTSAIGASYYKVYRHTSNDSTAVSTPISSPPASAGTSFENTGLTANTIYYYWLEACNGTGCSDFSSVASADTTKDWLAVSHTQTLTASSYIQSVAFSPDGTKIVSGSRDKTIKIWDVNDNYKLLKTIADSSTNTDGHSDYVNSVAFSPDGSKIVSGSDDQTIKIWDVSDNYKLLKTIADSSTNTDGHSDYVNSVTFSPDGTKIVSGSDDKTIKIWDVDNNYSLVKTFEAYDVNTNPNGHSGYVESVAFSPDGSKIVSGSHDYTIKIWDVNDNYKLLKTIADSSTNTDGHSEWIRSVAFSPDGTKIVSGSDDKTIKIWDVSDNYKLLKTIADSSTNTDGHSNYVISVAFSPDGTKIVSGSRDKTIKIWDVDNNYSLVKTFEVYDVNTNPNGHGNYVKSVAFSSDGTKIVSGSADFTIKIWE